jgi:TnpA family transposase
MAEAALEHPDDAVEVVIYPAAGGKKTLEALVKEHQAGQSYQQQVLAAIRRSYQNHVRRMVAPVQKALEFESNNTVHRPVIKALDILKTYGQSHSPYYPADVDIPLEGVVPQQMRDWVVITNDEGEVKINRINYEICVLQTLREQVRCKEIWVAGADKHRNPDEDLPQDFEGQRERYYQSLNQPLEADSFLVKVKTEMREALTEFNEGFPKNADVTLRESKRKRIKLTPLEAQPEPANITQLKQEIGRRWGVMNLIDILKETELRVGFTRMFKSVTAWQSLSSAELQKRLLLCIYGLGTNIGLKRVSLAEPGISYHDLVYIQRRFLQRDALRQAIAAVANATFAARQASIWGETTTACASDAKKFAAWDQNLLTEWHARYGGRGIMIYWHVERKSVCIHSQLKAPSSSEVAAMMQGVLRHCTTMEIDRHYVDTHGQSVIAFAFSHVLGFDLMPRLKGISRQRLRLPDQADVSKYPHLQPILTRPIRWDLIRQQYDQIIKYATALKFGPAEAEAILRRFTRNTQHPTYRALVELGNARKTTFLCRYLHRLAVRHEVQEGLNVIEDWNNTNTFILYGKSSEFATNRLRQQETIMLCLHLLQACLVYINTLLIQEVLSSSDWYQQMTQEDWRALTPLFFTSITPYGSFRLDMTKRIPGLADIV